MAKKSNVNIPAIQVIRIIVFLFIGLVCFVTYSRAQDFLKSSPLFAVHDVVIDSSIQFIDTTQLRQLKGRNIFDIDVKQLHRKLQKQYPQISQLRVVKEMPDRIKVLAKKRDPLFQIPIKGKFLIVDKELVAMYFSDKAIEVPQVLGALNNTKLVMGRALPRKSLAPLALSIIGAFKAHPHTARLKITSIDLTNVSKIDVTCSGVFHVLLDQESHLAKLDFLNMLLEQKKIDFNTIKYVDLRFNEPVLGENN